ncbi:MAG: F0F1 ATP synthase subunit A [Bacteroidales bacterium]|nr:F0F1 ATP synthase subunit A [Bacteroidales bacterium]MCF8456503.1 F0F1 ATP synthase subunit A [Bacteroidales bacterium]
MSWFSIHKSFTTLLAILIAISFSAGTVLASEPEGGHDPHGSAKFEPGSFIMDHIADSYDWHVATIGDFHLSLPLPIILISKEQGLKIFMSSKFHHGHETHSNFMLMMEGENKGKIVETLSTGEQVLPLDFSITKNVLAIFFSLGLLLWVFISIAKSYQRREGQAPKGMQSFLEPLIIFIRDDVAKASIGEKKYERYVPYLLTIFFFIFLNNLLGLVPILPGGANVTGNIAVTLVLALFTFGITTFSGNGAYWKHIFWPDVPSWLKVPIPLMPVVELIGVFTKPFVLMVRLFANITAGHIIALGFFSLIFIFGSMNIVAGYGISILSIAFTIFMTFLELLVAFIQAYVFTLLSALYFGMAVEEHH